MAASEVDYSIALKFTYGDICWNNPPKDIPPTPEEMLEKFIEKIIFLKGLSFIIIPQHTSILNYFKIKKGFSKICTDENYLKQNKNDFMKIAMKNGMIVFVDFGGRELIKLYKNSRWEISRIPIHEATDDILKYLDIDILKLISKFPKEFFLFNHDADPVYFLSKSVGVRRWLTANRPTCQRAR